MTVLDLNPRLAAAKRRRRAERLGAYGSGSAELAAAQLRLMFLPALFGCVLLDELTRYMEAAAQALVIPKMAASGAR